MTRLMSFARRLPFALGALAAWAASAGFNGLFGWKLGGDSLELRVLWVLLFVAFDIMKGGAGLKLTAALRNRDALRILLAAGMLMAGTSLSLLAAFQWRVLAKAEAEAARRQIVETRAALATTIEQDRVKASQLAARDLASIEVEMLGFLVAAAAIRWHEVVWPKPLAWLAYLVEGHTASFIGAMKVLTGRMSRW